MSRARRTVTQKDNSSKFAELRALKQSGRKRIDTYQDNVEDDIYHELDEDDYKKVVRDRLDKDDFVVDDNGLGYADNGMDEWDERHQFSEDEGDRHRRKGRNGPSTKKTDTTAETGAMQKFLAKLPPKTVVKTVSIQFVLADSRTPLNRMKTSWRVFSAKSIRLSIVESGRAR